MTDITWEEPPPIEVAAPREPKYLPIAAALRENPGEWAVVTEDGWVSMASTISNGGLAAFRPRGAFEGTVVREGKSQRGKVYARYLGEPTAPVAQAPSADIAPYEAKIRAEERERVAVALESHRLESWNGSQRKPGNFGYAASFVRSLT